MKNFTKMMKKATENCLVGVSENRVYRCFCFDNGYKKTCYWQNREENEVFLLPKVLEFTSNSAFVRSVPFQYIWRKYLFLPISDDKTLIYRQLLQVLQQELPLSLEEVYFDYQLFPLKKEGLIKVIVYALRKSYAHTLMIRADTILDCELYCFVRGFNALSSSDLDQENRIYALTDRTFRLTGKEIEFNTDLTLANCRLEQLELEDSIKDPFLYVTAFGASLWNGKG
ncbi:pilus assembly protein PilM [Actinobacillus genomosp. 2]|uniref:pilus assembly protein PilM n=1 Tax=Actinobacillus genomosp. 2 TaxID=230709 RepID=UPI0024415393|nr:pilus assembly protein PilM [Actinobacillus genomosp. 2]WGE32224.1 pilus assembly protein PilM [Actinobacillus genomosp. 2]